MQANELDELLRRMIEILQWRKQGKAIKCDTSPIIEVFGRGSHFSPSSSTLHSMSISGAPSTRQRSHKSCSCMITNVAFTTRLYGLNWNSRNASTGGCMGASIKKTIALLSPTSKGYFRGYLQTRCSRAA